MTARTVTQKPSDHASIARMVEVRLVRGGPQRRGVIDVEVQTGRYTIVRLDREQAAELARQLAAALAAIPEIEARYRQASGPGEPQGGVQP